MKTKKDANATPWPSSTAASDHRPKWRASMSVALGLGLGFFVLTTVASVLGVGLVNAYQNTADLLQQKAQLLISAEQSQLNQYLRAAEEQTGFVRRMIRSGEQQAGPQEDFFNLLLGTLAATPQIIAIHFIDAGYHLTGAERREDDTTPLYAAVYLDDTLRAIVDQARQDRAARWGAPIWREEYAQALLNYNRPVFVEERFLGVLSAWISVQKLAELIADVDAEFGENAFILYGRGHVLAHPLMVHGYDGLTRLTPLPAVTSFGDPVLASIWEPQASGLLERTVLRGQSIHSISIGDLRYVFLYRHIEGYTDRPLIIGTYFRSSDLLAEVGRLQWAIIYCLVISALAALSAALIGRQIARPVRRLAAGTARIHHLELNRVEPIPGSFFRELNEAGQSFNAMLDGLRWFERYVPKTLVRRLMRLNRQQAMESTFRDVAIMFTDIWGFTSLAENTTAPAIAELLNEHFALIAQCVEREGGTIDKYIGDTVMAVWGAPEAFDDCGERACRAAIAARDALLEYNRRQGTLGKPRIRVRIGIHVGRVVAGNIGSPGRINYTVIGDPVNVAQRLEALSKRLGSIEAEVNILVSGAVRASVTSGLVLVYLGTHAIRGRREPIEVYELGG